MVQNSLSFCLSEKLLISPSYLNEILAGLLGFPSGSVVKDPPDSVGDARGVGSIPGSREWQPTPVFLPAKSHGQRSLAGYSPWGRKTLGQN